MIKSAHLNIFNSIIICFICSKTLYWLPHATKLESFHIDLFCFFVYRSLIKSLNTEYLFMFLVLVEREKEGKRSNNSVFFM